MRQVELQDRIGAAKEIVLSELGDFNALGVVPGTGWKEGVARAFKPRLTIPYDRLGIPGAELVVDGHQKNLIAGDIDGRDVLLLGRVHPNEDSTHPDLRQAMNVVVASVSQCLDGLIVTNGVGSLHGPVGAEQGRIKSFVRTLIIDILGWAQRGRSQEPINVGDIAIVDDVKTGLVGPYTPLGAGQFVDFYHNGIHGQGDKFFNLVQRAISDVQGRCPRAQARFIPGPHFEGLADKIEFRAAGDDVIGMSGVQEVLTAVSLNIPVQQIVLATNGPFAPHSHESNQEVGVTNASKAEKILRILADRWPRRGA